MKTDTEQYNLQRQIFVHINMKMHTYAYYQSE